MSETEGVLPVLVLMAVAAIAALTMMRRLGLFLPVTLQVRTVDQKAKMKEIQSLRKVKEDFLKAQDAEEVSSEAPPDIEDRIQKAISERRYVSCFFHSAISSSRATATAPKMSAQFAYLSNWHISAVLWSSGKIR